jgi:hypothetical protein
MGTAKNLYWGQKMRELARTGEWKGAGGKIYCQDKMFKFHSPASKASDPAKNERPSYKTS